MPHIDCYTHMHNWLAHLQKKIPRPLEDDDYIFPGISSTGQLKFGEGPISRTAFETLLENIISDSGVLEGRNGKFTTHCFRRGGCQYRFMWAPVKWSLKAVKWWGGWSSNDNVGTIMRYLLDELMTFEESFGDIMMKTRLPNRHEVIDDRSTNAQDDCLTKAQLEAVITQFFEKLASSPISGECQIERNFMLLTPLLKQFKTPLRNDIQHPICILLCHPRALAPFVQLRPLPPQRLVQSNTRCPFPMSNQPVLFQEFLHAVLWMMPLPIGTVVVRTPESCSHSMTGRVAIRTRDCGLKPKQSNTAISNQLLMNSGFIAMPATKNSNLSTLGFENAIQSCIRPYTRPKSPGEMPPLAVLERSS